MLWIPKAVQRSALCRSRRELSNAYLLAKFGLDTAENEPCQVCPIEQCSDAASFERPGWAASASSARLEAGARTRAGAAARTARPALSRDEAKAPLDSLLPPRSRRAAACSRAELLANEEHTGPALRCRPRAVGPALTVWYFFLLLLHFGKIPKNVG